jgi:hypothetical protein
MFDVARMTLNNLAGAKSNKEFLESKHIGSFHFDIDECKHRPTSNELDVGTATTFPVFLNDNEPISYKQCMILSCPSVSAKDREYIVCHIDTFGEILFESVEEEYLIYSSAWWPSY